jgi:hypothetical protein
VDLETASAAAVAGNPKPILLVLLSSAAPKLANALAVMSDAKQTSQKVQEPLIEVGWMKRIWRHLGLDFG